MSAVMANADACGQAGDALSALGTALEQTQQVTRQAMAECIRGEGEMTAQQGVANRAGQTAATATATAAANAAAAPHPTLAASYRKQASKAEIEQIAAQGAADRAQGELEAAQRRDQQACETYAHEARATTGQLLAAAGPIRSVPAVAGGAPVPITVTPGNVSVAAAPLVGAAGGIRSATRSGHGR